MLVLVGHSLRVDWLKADKGLGVFLMHLVAAFRNLSLRGTVGLDGVEHLQVKWIRGNHRAVMCACMLSMQVGKVIIWHLIYCR